MEGIYLDAPKRGEVTPQVGQVQLPEWLWYVYITKHQEELLSSTTENRRHNAQTSQMLEAITHAGALGKVTLAKAMQVGVHVMPTATIFTIPQNEEKAKLILNVVLANLRQLEGSYKVPKVAILRESIFQATAGVRDATL